MADRPPVGPYNVHQLTPDRYAHHYRRECVGAERERIVLFDSGPIGVKVAEYRPV
jgi:hypothetical protein